MQKKYYAVIMAGGGGTRLWPLSRRDTPKQMLRLVDDRTMFQTAIQRLNGMFDPENILVVTVKDQADALRDQCPEIPAENFLIEPMPKGTASVVGFAAAAIQSLEPDSIMAVLTSDHIIVNEDKFQRILQSAFEVAQKGYMVTLGISPTHPSTGYGYIQQGDMIDKFLGLIAYKVQKFVEKPSEIKAQEMIRVGNYTWNSGMFIWKVDRIMDEFSRQMPELFSKLNEISSAWTQPHIEDVVRSNWQLITPQTIDYGIMENARKVAVIPAVDLGWSDIGSWNELFNVLPSDENGNIKKGGEHITLDTKETLVFTNQGDRLIVTIGVEDLVVVDTRDVLLLCKKDDSQKVRQVVNYLKETSKWENI